MSLKLNAYIIAENMNPVHGLPIGASIFVVGVNA
jgi:hypothetical protein